MLVDKRDGMFEVPVGNFTFAKGALPEAVFFVIAVLIAEDYRQCYFTFSEIIANDLAKLCGLAVIVKRVVNKLK